MSVQPAFVLIRRVGREVCLRAFSSEIPTPTWTYASNMVRRWRRSGAVACAPASELGACRTISWFQVGGPLGLVCCAVALALSGCASPYLLTVEDVVCPVGEKARLVGKLEYRGVAVLNKGIDDRDLRFVVGGQLVGDDETNDEGYARVKHRFDSPGVADLEVQYEDGRGRVHSALGRVFVWSQDRPVLVVDIDGTVSQTKTRYLLGNGLDRSKPLPDAASVLGELAERFCVVYLTARPREMAVKTRRWLGDHGFPPGPVLTWDIDKYEWSATDYKKDRLDDLKDQFDHVTVGIGNAESDHKAYRKRKLLSILIDPDAPAGGAEIERGVAVPDWAAVRRVFATNPCLFDPELSYKVELVVLAE